MRKSLLVACLVGALAGCRPGPPRGSCTYVTGAASVPEACRDDGTANPCDGTFTSGLTCPQIGFACAGDGIDAAWRKTGPGATCPPGSALVR